MTVYILRENLLHQAVKMGDAHAGVVQSLIYCGAPLDEYDRNGAQPLHVAVMNDNISALRILIAAGADPNDCSADVVSPLHIAATNRNHEAMRILLEYGANKSLVARRATPLGIAEHNGDQVAIQLLSGTS